MEVAFGYLRGAIVKENIVEAIECSYHRFEARHGSLCLTLSRGVFALYTVIVLFFFVANAFF